MATPKRIQIEFDLNTNDVKIASEATLTLAQQVRILKQELQKTQEGTKEFDILKNKLNETKDNFERVNVKSRELFGTLSLIPGPIGEIAGKLNGAVSLLKVFSGFSLKDLQGQFKALIDDVKGIFSALGTWGENTEELTTNVNGLTDSTDNLNSTLANVSSNAGAAGDSVAKYSDELSKQIETADQNILKTKQQIDAVSALEEKRYDELIAIGEVRDLTAEESAEIDEFTKTQMQLSSELDNQIEVRQNLETSIKSNTVATNALTKSQQVAATAGRVLKGVLASIGIGLLIIGITTLITKIYEWATSTKEADAANEKLGETINELNRILDANISKIDEEIQIQTIRAKIAGKSEKEINDIAIEGIKKRIAAFKKGNEDIFKEILLLEANFTLTEEQRKKRADELTKQYLDNGKKIVDLESQIRIQTVKGEEIVFNSRKKNSETAGAQRKKDLEELTQAQRDASLLLMKEKEREIAQIEEKYKKQIALAKQYKQDTTNLEEARRKEISDINKKYDKEDYNVKLNSINAIIEREEMAEDVDVERLKRLYEYRKNFELENAKLTEKSSEEKLLIIAKYDKLIRDLDKKTREDKLVQDIASTRGNFDKQIELYRQFAQQVIGSKQYTAAEELKIIEETNAKIEQLQEERLENEKTKLDLSLQQGQINNQKYFNELITLYDKEIEALKLKKLREEIVEADFNKRLKALTDARNKIKLDEKEAQIALIDAIGNGFSALSQIVGEQTKQGKALAVAATLINTYAAIAAQLRASASSTGGAIPGYAIAQAIATGIFGLAQVRKILATPVPGSSGGGSGGVTAGGVINVTQRRAQGGMITGSGGEFSDNIPAMLSNGEFVMNARSTRVFRPLLESMNAAANLPRFAVGGMVNQGITPPKSQNETLTEAISSAFGQTPIRTYVTATEVSNQQQFDRIIKSRSLI